MTKEELVNIIANHLPMSTEDAENFIDAANNGYTWGNIDYAMAMSSRDKKIEQLRKVNQKFIDVTSKCVIDRNNGISLLDIIMSEL